MPVLPSSLNGKEGWTDNTRLGRKQTLTLICKSLSRNKQGMTPEGAQLYSRDSKVFE